jgi:hypothetical protein
MEGISVMDGPGLLLTIAVRRMPAERSDWGAAMLAELAQLQHPSTRWQFALGCTRVALFPPRKGGYLQAMMNHKTKNILTALGTSALLGLLFMLPFAFLEYRYNTANLRLSRDYIFLFGLLWFLPTAFFTTIAPLARAVRAGNNVLAHPISLLFRVALLILLAMFWVGLINDQMPCFLGVPNCD